MNRLQMHDGWPYVAGAYATTAVVFGAWFWMIGVKLRRVTRLRRTADAAAAKVGGDD